jgi:hypothetical protein
MDWRAIEGFDDFFLMILGNIEFILLYIGLTSFKMEAAIDTKAPKTWGMLYKYLPHVMVKETLSFLEPANGRGNYLNLGFWEKIDFKTDTNSMLTWSIMGDKMNVVVECLKYCSALDFACKLELMCCFGRLDMLNMIETDPGSVIVTDGLISACKNGHIECVKYLMERFPDVKSEGAYTSAKACDRDDILDLLVGHPVHGVFYKTLIFLYKCVENDLEQMKRVAGEIKDADSEIPLNVLNEYLIVAARRGYLDIVKYLIELGADNIMNATIVTSNYRDRHEIVETYQYLRQLGVEKLGYTFPKHL